MYLSLLIPIDRSIPGLMAAWSGIAPYMPTVGLLGAEALWLGAYLYGHWDTTDRKARDSWLMAGVMAALAYWVIQGIGWLG